ncbi:MAG: EamA family transporter [Pseudomonadota bacterium]
MKATPRDWFLLSSLGLIWGCAFMATTVATHDFETFTLSAARLAIGTLALVAILAWRGETLPGFRTSEERRFWLFAFGEAITAYAIPFTLLSWAQRHVDSSFAGVVVASVPLFILPMAYFFVPGENMSWRKVIGFLLGFLGIVVLMGPDSFTSLGGDTVTTLAQLACLGVALGYASGSIIAKLAPQLGLVRFGTASLIVATALMTPIALATEGLPTLPSTEGALAMLYLGLIPTGLATVMLLSVIASAGPGFFSLVNYQVPVWAVIFGIIVLAEKPSATLGYALILIFLGLAISQNLLGLRRGGHAKG